MSPQRSSSRIRTNPPRWNWRRNPGLFIAVIFLAAVFSRFTRNPQTRPVPPQDDETVRVKRVVDGDTLLLESGVRVRLIGVDTPETKIPHQPPEPWGPEASEFTRRMVEGKQVRLEFDRERTDQYGRTLAYVYLEERMLNEALIEAGLTRAETRFPFRSDRKQRFRELETAARAAGHGMWSRNSSDPGRR